jgi:hypothetical protein
MVNNRREEKMIGLFFLGIVVTVIVMAVLIHVRKYDAK